MKIFLKKANIIKGLKNIKIKENYAIYHYLIIDGSLTMVFESVSEPNNLVNWWPLKCSGSPEI